LSLAEARRDAFSGAVLLAGAVALWLAIPHQVQTLDGESLTPASAPRALTALLGLLGALLVVRGVASSGARGDGVDAEEERPRGPRLARAGAAFALLVAYVGAMPVLGYLVSTGLVLAALAWLFGLRRPLVLALLAIGTPPLLFYFFRYTLLVLLPIGSVFR